VILVDTSVLVDFLRGRETPAAARLLEAIDRDIPFGFSPITVLEVLQGVATAKDFRALRDYLGSQPIFELREGLDSYAAAAKIFFDLRRRGITVGSSIDCLIAQTAIEHGLHLLHADSDFDRIAEVSPLQIW
jgi:predicted nucleic acid-binding protein